MIRHIVLTRCRPGLAERAIVETYAGLAALTERMPGARSFSGGPSASPEQLERGYTHGFVIDFDSWDALAEYAEHPDHQALGGQLVDHAVGGIDGLLVVDLVV